MPTVLTQEEVTVERLISHLAEKGIPAVQFDEMQFNLRTVSGIAFWISIEEDRHFIRFHTYLPTSKAKSRSEMVEFTHQLSSEVFLPTFALDSDNDVLVSYLMCYESGLLLGHVEALVLRFSSLLEYLVHCYDTTGIFDFGPSPVSAIGEDEFQSLICPEGTLLN